MNRTTTILGAGAVLDFKFKGQIPTTWNITQALRDIKVDGLDGGKVSLAKDVYEIIVECAKHSYSSIHAMDRCFEPNVNFEDLFNVIETLYSYNTAWLKEGIPYPLVCGCLSPKVNYQTCEYQSTLVEMVKKILEIVNAYNEEFMANNESELWYRKFWRGFGGKNDLFNFNYDTTVECSLEPDYNDGFIGFTQDYERFSPKHLMDNEKQQTTVNHLHGCVLYSDVNPLSVQYEYNHRDLFKFYSSKDAFISRQWMPTNQAKEHISYSPIITGLKKTDKICYLPHSYYHSNLAMKILENPSLLIVGYSFGDIYVNQLLERHKLIHQDNQRVVIIDKYPNKANDDWSSLYQHFLHNTSTGFHNFLLRQLEGANQLDVFQCNIQKNDSNVWQSKHGRLQLYTGGFKDAVTYHNDEIMEFLQ